MIITKDFFTKHKKCLVVGAGASGLAASKLLRSLSCQLYISDGGQQKDLGTEWQTFLGQDGIKAEFGGHSAEFFCQVDLIVVSPGVPLNINSLQAARQVGITIIGELALGALFCQAPIIAITGTNGKTTVTTMVTSILEGAGKKVFTGGNIGTPLCDFVISGRSVDYLVLEVSSFQLDTIQSFRAKIAVLLNISPDHLDRYDNYGAYAASKMAIFRNQQDDDIAIINGTDEEINKRLELIPGPYVTFNDWPINFTIPAHLDFYPNRDNCLVAAMVARQCQLSSVDIAKGLEMFQPLEHRLTEVARVAGVTYIDDSKATNIGALQSALAGLPPGVILIAGGKDKGGDYQVIKDDIAGKVRCLLLIGEATEKMAGAFGDVTEVYKLTTLPAAVKKAHELAKAGDTVLLSPACASFDMFKSYSDRGQFFAKAVRALN